MELDFWLNEKQDYNKSGTEFKKFVIRCVLLGRSYLLMYIFLGERGILKARILLNQTRTEKQMPVPALTQNFLKPY